MSSKKNNIRRKKRNHKRIETIVVTRTIIPAEETLFPETLKRVNALLKKAKLMDMPGK